MDRKVKEPGVAFLFKPKAEMFKTLRVASTMAALYLEGA